MNYPTFGGEDGKLAICVQSLDRKGDLKKSSDRYGVLVNRAPKRHRSITALNFFNGPPPSEPAPPVPVLPPSVPVARPLPRFLEVFTPLSDDSAGLVSSNVSTPSSLMSSLPVTPSSPRRELGNDVHQKGARSYFLLTPNHHPHNHHERTLVANNESRCIATPDVYPVDTEGTPEEWQRDDEQQQKHGDMNGLHPQPTTCTRLDRSSVVWVSTGGSPHRQHEGSLLMMDGTFGRV